MRALSFIGTGISSSELSLAWALAWAEVPYCCDRNACAEGTGFDSARLMAGLEGALRSPDRSDVFLVGAAAAADPMAEWLLEPIGVGDAVAITGGVSV